MSPNLPIGSFNDGGHAIRSHDPFGRCDGFSREGKAIPDATSGIPTSLNQTCLARIDTVVSPTILAVSMSVTCHLRHREGIA
jgi:hypothetical protein